MLGYNSHVDEFRPLSGIKKLEDEKGNSWDLPDEITNNIHHYVGIWVAPTPGTLSYTSSP